VLTKYTNSVEQRFKGDAKRAQYSWDQIASISDESAAYVKIAKEMGVQYGYPERQPNEQVSYCCGFDIDDKWDCKIIVL